VNESTWQVHNPGGPMRVIVTKALPGERWLEILIEAGCRVEVCRSESVLGTEEIEAVVGDRCEGGIGQLTEPWGPRLFEALARAGGKAYSNYAVGYNNVDLEAATKHRIPVGNTPGVLTETTAELAVALTFAAARRVVEGDRFMRGGRFSGWLPSLFLGELLWRKTLGIVGAGRIGTAYARMMAEGHKMDVVYYDLRANRELEHSVASYGHFLEAGGRRPVTCRRADSLEELLREADVVSLHTVLDAATRHLIDRGRLALMKENAVLVNSSRGPLIDENALVEHCRRNPSFRAALDVFEDEPDMAPGLADLPNVVVVPHIGSATRWTREAMAVLAAFNVAGMLQGFPVWGRSDMTPFLGPNPPKASPSVVNAEPLALPSFEM
jgi:hydroxypyruvate reductase 1